MHAYMSGPELFISEETDTFNQFASIPVWKHHGPSIYYPTPFALHTASQEKNSDTVSILLRTAEEHLCAAVYFLARSTVTNFAFLSFSPRL